MGQKYEVDGAIHEPEVIDGLTVYRKPEPEGRYVAGCDVAEGLGAEGDWSAVTIFDRRNGEEVAFFRGKLPPDRFGERLDSWGRLYGGALMVVETNNHGLTTLTVLKQRLYPNLYFRPKVYDKSGDPISDRLGWKTSVVTKPLMIDDLDRALRDGTVTFRTQRTLDEMVTFLYNERGQMSAMDGANDDCLVSAAVALQGFKVTMPTAPSQIDWREHFPSGGY